MLFDSATANGGPGRDRTGDLIVANDALSQLSYRPLYNKNNARHDTLPYPFWILVGLEPTTSSLRTMRSPS
jgi:hypothetical protein